MEDMHEADMKRLQEALHLLGEHFDAVEIIASRSEVGEMGGTVSCSKGCGNYFARFGAIKEWLVRQEERMRQQQMQNPSV